LEEREGGRKGKGKRVQEKWEGDEDVEEKRKGSGGEGKGFEKKGRAFSTTSSFY